MEVNYVELSRLWEKQYHLMKNDKEQLEQENAKLRIALNTCKNDYWFMTNLLNRCFSNNLEDSAKSCIERMEFRKPIFNFLNEINKAKKEVGK